MCEIEGRNILLLRCNGERMKVENEVYLDNYDIGYTKKWGEMCRVEEIKTKNYGNTIA